MKAIRFHEIGGPEVLRLDDVPVPEPGPDDALIAVRAVGVNFADTERRRGIYDNTGQLPRIPGLEAAGVVARVGSRTHEHLVGQRVATLARGSYAEYVVAKVSELALVPDDLPFELAAALPVQGLTAYHLVHTVGKVRRDQSVLVHAAAGGVGGLAVQLAKLLGARVIGTVSSDEKAAVARALGADEVIRYDQTEVAPAVRAATGGVGVDLVLDAVGATTFKGSLAALAPFGHLIIYGNASGLPPHVDVEELYPNSLKVSAYWLLSPHPPDLQRQALAALIRDVAAGTLKVTLGLRLPLERAAEAHRLLETRATVGKVVLEVA